MPQPQQYAPAQPYGGYPAPVMVQPGMPGQPPPQAAPAGAPQAGKSQSYVTFFWLGVLRYRCFAYVL